MIIEHEFMVQLDGQRWLLSRCVEFLSQYKDPWPVLGGLYRDGCLVFQDNEGKPVPDWKIKEVLRNKNPEPMDEIYLDVTDAGAKRAWD